MLFGRGVKRVDDTIVHEMLHADLWLAGGDWEHDSDAWYDAVQRLSSSILGRPLDIRRGADRKSVRVPNPAYGPGNGKPKTLVRKERQDVGWTHDMVSRWPSAFRPDGYNWGKRIRCPTY